MSVCRTLALAALSFAAAVAVAQTAERFTTRLDTVPIDRRTQAVVTGDGAVSAELVGNALSVEGAFAGLSGAATEAWLHIGAVAGARGPAAHQLDVVQNSSGTLNGTVRLSRREIEALAAGRVYVQVHSEVAPEGNLWGWLLPQE